MPEHSLVDRIVRGRTWIPLLGVLLAGIVATQVEILKLNASMGRWIEQATTLGSRNESLQAGVAALDNGQRIESLAARMGMVMPQPTAISFLAANRGDVGAAVANIHQPDPYQFVANLPAADTRQASTTTSTQSSTTGAGLTTAGAGQTQPTTSGQGSAGGSLGTTAGGGTLTTSGQATTTSATGTATQGTATQGTATQGTATQGTTTQGAGTGGTALVGATATQTGTGAGG